MCFRIVAKEIWFDDAHVGTIAENLKSSTLAKVVAEIEEMGAIRGCCIQEVQLELDLVNPVEERRKSFRLVA